MKRIIEGIEPIGWETTSAITFTGAVLACMHQRGEALANDEAMGITGGAFFLFWHPQWSPANCALTLLGEEPVRRTFASLGYAYEYLPDYHRDRPRYTREFVRDRIVAGIDQGRPVIAVGIVGPPECGVVAGYERGGDVLLGRSYFQEDQAAYYRAEGWYPECYGLILIGEKQAEPDRRAVLRSALQWAIWLARTPSFVAPHFITDNKLTTDEHANGLAAYDAMADDLLRDHDFPAGDLATLTDRLTALSADGIWLLCAKRADAAKFLERIAGEGHPGAGSLCRAAAEYAREAKLLDEMRQLAPGPWASEEERLTISERSRRVALSAMVRQARAMDERAVAHLEEALEALPG